MICYLNLLAETDTSIGKLIIKKIPYNLLYNFIRGNPILTMKILQLSLLALCLLLVQVLAVCAQKPEDSSSTDIGEEAAVTSQIAGETMAKRKVKKHGPKVAHNLKEFAKKHRKTLLKESKLLEKVALKRG